LSKKELSRVEVMGRVKAHSLRLCEAGELLGLSYREAKRIWARYRGGKRRRTLASWCRWTEVFMSSWKSAGRGVA
jgi:hypothetical protein